MGTQISIYYEQKDFSVDRLKHFAFKLAKFCDISTTDKKNLIFLRHLEDGFETSTQSSLSEFDTKMVIDFPLKSITFHFGYHIIIFSLRTKLTNEMSISYMLHGDLDSAKKMVFFIENTLALTRIDLDVKPKNIDQPYVNPDPTHAIEDKTEMVKSSFGSVATDMTLEQIRDEKILGKYRHNTKEAIMNFIESVDNEGLEKLWKFISENYEVVVTEQDREAIEKGMKEIEEGKFRFI